MIDANNRTLFSFLARTQSFRPKVGHRNRQSQYVNHPKMKTDDLFVRAKLFFFSFRSQRSNENRFDRRRKPEEQRLVSSSSQCFLADLRRNSPTTTTTTSSNVSSADWSSFAGKTFQKRKNIQRDFLFSVRQNENFVSPIVKLLIQRLKPAINDELVRQIGKVYQFNIATLGEFYLDLKNGSFFCFAEKKSN